MLSLSVVEITRDPDQGLLRLRVLVVATVVAAVALSLAAGSAEARPAGQPTKAQVEAQTRAAVRSSGARVVRLRIVGPNLTYELTVQVDDPAAYLKHRTDPVVTTMNRLRFHSRYLAVINHSGRRVFWVRKAGSLTEWNVWPSLVDCAKGVGFDLELDPDGTAPSCPAR